MNELPLSARASHEQSFRFPPASDISVVNRVICLHRSVNGKPDSCLVRHSLPRALARRASDNR